MPFPRLLYPALLLTVFPVLFGGCDSGRTVHTVERSFELGDIAHLDLADGAGDLEVIGEEGRDDVTLIARLKTHRASSAADDAAERAMQVGLRLGEGSGRIFASLHNPPPGYYIDLVALVPTSVAMDIDDGSGDLRVENIAGLQLLDDSGDVLIEDIAGNVTIVDDSGDLLVEGVGGDLEIDDDSGDIAVFGVAGKATIDDGSGDMALHDIRGRTLIDDGSGDIAAVHCADVDIRSDGSGDVAVVD